MNKFMLKHSRHLCLLRPVAVGVVVVMNVLHPFLHVFEGGSLDIVLHQIDMWAYMLAGSNVPTEEAA